MKQSALRFAGVEEDEARERDRHMLACLVDCVLSERENDAFDSMREWIEAHEGKSLSRAQREWVEAACEREGVNTTPERLRKPVSRGKEVPLADVLRRLPLKPPGRR